MAVKTFTIDGQAVTAEETDTILQAATDAGIKIPTLCHLDGLGDVGACRLCITEVSGTNKLLPACVTKVSEGMEIKTNSERIQKYRRMILELLFAERNHVCSVCVANRHCELQTLAEEHGMMSVRFPYQYPNTTVDASHDWFILDHNRCVLCTRCVRVCDEVEGAHVWDVMGRGTNSRVITDLNQPWGDSETCTSCSKCVQVCPTGALSSKGKSVAEMVKKRDFLPYLMATREEKI
ncbi:MAG: bidirectional hydrogenase complex protein HoxU [Methylacidiphilales bacterium]|nr:bidirectional hydrogenase complex protein HoxU [Candidatus Methylacidiphilales bacterium]